jgi:diguanylate cyclase (GGDEF)-like protein
LRRTAQAIASACRREDIPYRYGGEEFLVTLPGGNLDAALTAAERMRAAVQSEAIPHGFSDHSVVTVSGGVASWGTAYASLIELLEAADQALYGSKSAGRNRVQGADGALAASLLLARTSKDA